jgi:hypothetical protein
MEFWYGLYGMQSPRVYPRSWTRMYQEVVDHAARAEDLNTKLNGQRITIDRGTAHTNGKAGAR